MWTTGKDKDIWKTSKCSELSCWQLRIWGILRQRIVSALIRVNRTNELNDGVMQQGHNWWPVLFCHRCNVSFAGWGSGGRAVVNNPRAGGSVWSPCCELVNAELCWKVLTKKRKKKIAASKADSSVNSHLLWLGTKSCTWTHHKDYLQRPTSLYVLCLCEREQVFADIQTVVMMRRYFFDTTLSKRAAPKWENVG